MKHPVITLIILPLFLAACTQATRPASSDVTGEATQEATQEATEAIVEPQPSGPLTLTSTAFANEGDIPAKYGQVAFSVPMDDGVSFVCTNFAESANISPPLNWSNVPAEAVSLALIVGDQMNYAYPDAPPDAIFPHWIVYNIPPDSTGLSEGQPADEALADGSVQGINAYPPPYDMGYGGPCPGAEKHLYKFTLYALDTELDLPAGAEMDTVLEALADHILGQAELIGYYTGT